MQYSQSGGKTSNPKSQAKPPKKQSKSQPDESYRLVVHAKKAKPGGSVATRESSLDPNSLGEEVVYKLKPLAGCGCFVGKAEELGGVCRDCGAIICKRHIQDKRFQCARCGKPVCMECRTNDVSDDDPIAYCKSCRFYAPGNITFLLLLAVFVLVLVLFFFS